MTCSGNLRCAAKGADPTVSVAYPPPKDDGGNAIQFRDVLRLLLRGAPFALLVTLVAVGVAVYLTQRMDSVFRAEVTLVVTQSALRVTNIEIVSAPVVDPGVYRTAVFEGGVLHRALDRVSQTPVGQREIERVAQAIEVTIEPQSLSSIIRVAVRNTSPTWAADLANAIADELVVWDYTRAQTRLMQGVAAIERSIAAIDVELADGAAPITEARRQALVTLRGEHEAALDRTRTAAAAAVYVPLTERLSTAVPPTDRVAPRPVLNVAIAVLLGLMLGYGLVLILAVTNPRVTNRDELERFSGLPVLAEFPRSKLHARQPSDEATGWLHARLVKMKSPSTCLVVAVTGLRSPDDHARVAIGLAEAFARAGDRTLLIDADLRNARTSHELGVTGSYTTDESDRARTTGAADPAHLVRIAIDRDRGFDFAPAGTPMSRPADRLGRFFEQHREAWASSYDVMIVEAAPLLPYPDALVAASHAEGVVLCARVGAASRSDLQRAVRLMADQGIPVVGTVLTGSGRAPRELAHTVAPARGGNARQRQGVAGRT